jgi:hypothetical protein
VAGPRPAAAFATVSLDLATIPLGQRFGRVYSSSFLDPLGYGKTLSRFSDPSRRIPANRFGVLYFGSTLKVCFVEAVRRDQRRGLRPGSREAQGARSACFGGQGTVPYEQKTQQSPGFGRSSRPQPLQA